MRNYVLLLFAICCLSTAFAQEKVDDEINTIIRKHGLEESQVMDIASWLTDVHGPRLTGSPMLDQATEWATETLEDWGMQNVRTEAWGPFGKGWQLEHFEMHAATPGYFPVLAYPKAWSPSTDGVVTGEVVYLDAGNEEELEAYKGKLEGKFVLLDTIRNVSEWFDAPARRYEADDLLKMANAGPPTPRTFRGGYRGSGYSFRRMLWEFLGEEKPAAVIDRSYKGDLGTIFVSSARASNGGRSWDEDAEVIPQVTMAIEHYNRLFRLLNKGITPSLSMELKSSFHNEDGMEHNIIAEIPGTDLKDEIVMLGAHFDSWHTGTGATDNAAGSSVMMEAVRILLETFKEAGVKPRRTIRLALWTGEEQGLYGSKAYVGEHFAETNPNGTMLSLKPDQEKVSAYYNLDNGTGKIRGVYMQGNPAVEPIFRAWLEPFEDLDASTLTLRNTGGTDHLAFDAVGIPGFQFIQDPMAYFARTHHSNMEYWDRLVEDDLKQAATIIATFVYRTAQRDEMIPRKPMPKEEAEASN